MNFPSHPQRAFQWLQWYPKNLPLVGTLPPQAHELGCLKREEAEQHEPTLKGLQSTYIEGKVLEEEIKDGMVSVTIKVQLFKVIGEVVQIERYTLKKVKEHWLIDGQKIRDE